MLIPAIIRVPDDGTKKSQTCRCSIWLRRRVMKFIIISLRPLGRKSTFSLSYNIDEYRRGDVYAFL
jgi:hypothetical protein